LDADDEAYPLRLELQVGLFDKDVDVVAVGGGIDAVIMGYYGWRRVFRRKRRRLQLPVTHDGMALFLKSVLNPIAHSTLTFRKNAFEKVGGYREAMEKAEDFDLVLRLSVRGRLAGVEAPVGMIRFGGADSHTARHRPKGRDALFFAVTALLYHTAAGMSLECKQAEIENWLEKVGQDGVDALQGRWAFESVRNQEALLPAASKRLLLRTVVLRTAAVLRCRGRAWWHAAGSPASLLGEIVRSRQNVSQ
jgi:hypothetical protein